MDPRIKKLAKILVNYSCELKKDENTLIQCYGTSPIPLVRALVKEVYAAGARKFERVGEWIERIGWPKFFELTDIEFTKYHIDDFTHAGESYRRSVHFRQPAE